MFGDLNLYVVINAPDDIIGSGKILIICDSSHQQDGIEWGQRQVLYTTNTTSCSMSQQCGVVAK